MLPFFAIFCTLVCTASAQWGYSVDEMEVFDLADEFKGNFYEFLELPQSASTSEIRRAYRKLSLTMHPDKNKTEGAEENFRILAAIYEVLKNKQKREIYDNVLSDGIPSAYLYVPKPLRKMTLTEVSVIITLIVSLGHYLILWGSYAERRLVLEEYLPRLRKKKQKSRKKGDAQSDQEMDSVPYEVLARPQVIDVLPIAILRGIYSLIKFTPEYIRLRKEEALAKEEEKKRLIEEEERVEKERKMLQEQREAQKTMRKQRAKEKRDEMLQYVETSVKEEGNFYSPFESGGTIDEVEDLYGSSDDDKNAKKKKKKWSLDDDSTLIKLMTKHPAGSSQRWHLIADEMEKDVSDVIKCAKRLKGNIGSENTSARQRIKVSNKVPADACKGMETVRHYVEDGDSPKPDTKTVDSRPDCESRENWDSSSQKLFEMALRQFPKGTPGRWEKVAKCVPLKSKDDCIARYRQLVEMVQQKQKK